jgi:hypothetical protein
MKFLKRFNFIFLFLNFFENKKAPIDPIFEDEKEQLKFFRPDYRKLLFRVMFKRLYRFIKYYKIYTLKWLFLIGLIIGMIWFAFIKPERIVVVEVENDRQDTIIHEIFIPHLRSFDSLMYKVGRRESGNTWNKVRYNKNGVATAWGYFQFTKSGFQACKKAGLDISKIGLEFYLNNPDIQRVYFYKLIELNRESPRLIPLIKKYHMKEFVGIRGTVTESGILMGAHLVGEKAVLEFFYERKNTVDGNGTPVSSYIEEFSGYEIDY